MPLSDVDLGHLEAAGVGAVVVCEPAELSCFSYSGSRMVPMTRQVGLEEQHLSFAATDRAFLSKCIPQLLQRMLDPEPKIALVRRGWDADLVELVGTFIEAETSQLLTCHESVCFCVFDAALDGLAVVADEMYWFGSKHLPLRTSVCRPVEIDGSLTDSVRSNQDDSCFVDLASVTDIPAELGRIVWRCYRPPTQRDIEADELFAHVEKFDGCFSTEELAKSLCHPFAPRLNDVVWTYCELRRFEGRNLFIPMVGFNRTYLKAESLLAEFTESTSMEVTYADYVSVQELALSYSGTMAAKNNSPILNACQRCLRDSLGELRFLDLCEDVICELTGKVQFRLSLADVLRVYDEIKDFAHPRQESSAGSG